MNTMDTIIIAEEQAGHQNGKMRFALNTAKKIQAQCRPKPTMSDGEILPTPADSSSRYSMVTCGSFMYPPNDVHQATRNCSPFAA